MAMSEQLRKIIEEEVVIEMTPMIDVTFLLLVFFIVTMKFRVLEGKLDARLPKDMGQNAGGAPVDREKVRIRIKLVKSEPKKLRDMVIKRASFEEIFGKDAELGDTTFEQVFIVGESPVVRLVQKTTFNQGQPTTVYKWLLPNGSVSPNGPAPLLRKLEAAIRQFKDLPVIIDPDRSATYAALTTALHAATSAGFKEIQFSGKIGKS